MKNETETCVVCNGRGFIDIGRDGIADDADCPRCEGAGRCYYHPDCLNPDDCGSNGLPSSLCKNCGEAFRRDMEKNNVEGF